MGLRACLSLVHVLTGVSLTYHDSGGEEVLLDVGGQDATEPFEDVGHSDEAREILDGLLVGKLKRVVCCFENPALCLGLPLSTFFF